MRVGMRDRARDVQRHRAAGLEASGARAIEVGRVQRLGRAARVREVEHDQIVVLRGRDGRSRSRRRSSASTRGSSSAPRWTAARYLREMSTTDASISASVTDSHRRMLQQLLRRAAVAAADDQRALRRGMRDRRRVDEVLVIEELVLLGRHEMAVEPEKLAERHGVVHFDRLVRRAEAARARAPSG